ncbi:response regulator/sensory box/GGDEF domain/EAL domain protein [Pseudomonas sp. StFLB209]|uniref:diguanylate cyclase domain-containing protein n=1 Tax=Pseudomonas sp. StFLB209 TaxID=1028989 RepID=UPI0004F67DEB|nr:diguanylate cyclase [Pseudomonas sp. StFLB209]BAP46092.1 response regulator/sensory box/GGDEF domain/EAL domain protein [Pseudomonas sp. StFLB209]
MSQDITERKLAEKTLFDRATRDALLIAAAQRLLSCAGAGDLVGRLAGDEFVIIATTLSSTEAAENLGEQLCRALAEPFTFNGHTGIRIGASVGIAFSQP